MACGRGFHCHCCTFLYYFFLSFVWLSLFCYFDSTFHSFGFPDAALRSFFFLISSLLYTLGISELLVKLVSDLLSISLYQDISNFGEGKNYRQGFQFDLFLYSFSWGPIFYILQRYVRVCYLENYIRVWKFYCVLIMPYFFFGF